MALTSTDKIMLTLKCAAVAGKTYNMATYIFSSVLALKYAPTIGTGEPSLETLTFSYGKCEMVLLSESGKKTDIVFGSAGMVA
jgi:hypothetical protein